MWFCNHKSGFPTLKYIFSHSDNAFKFCGGQYFIHCVFALTPNALEIYIHSIVGEHELYFARTARLSIIALFRQKFLFNIHVTTFYILTLVV